MAIGSERRAVQAPFLRYAEEAGWTYLSPEQALSLTPRYDQPGPRHGPDRPAPAPQPRRGRSPAGRRQIRDRLVRVRPTIEGNLDAWEYLKGLKTVFVEDEKRERNLRLLDPVDLDANTFHVTDEFTFSNGTPPDIRTDLMLFINGVPIIVGETKIGPTARRHRPGPRRPPLLPPAGTGTA